MLTRLEADGFKNLIDFAVDFGPYTCIAGPNGVGKSNIFDAIHFLSLLADLSILEAALQVRSRTGSTARLDDLFFRSDAMHHDKFKIAAEMLVDQRVIDDFGRPGQATSTFLRYEIEIGRRTGAASADGLSLPTWNSVRNRFSWCAREMPERGYDSLTPSPDFETRRSGIGDSPRLVTSLRSGRIAARPRSSFPRTVVQGAPGSEHRHLPRPERS